MRVFRRLCQMAQGVSKGGAVDRILLELSREQRPPNFVLCIGDDRSDEDMFTAMEHVNFSPHMPAEARPLSSDFMGPAERKGETLILLSLSVGQ